MHEQMQLEMAAQGDAAARDLQATKADFRERAATKHLENLKLMSKKSDPAGSEHGLRCE